MSTIAKDEGYPEIAMFFQNLASVEKSMKQDALLLEKKSKITRCSRITPRLYGYAATADMSMLGKCRRKHVLSANIPKHILSGKRPIIKWKQIERATSHYIEKRNPMEYQNQIREAVFYKRPNRFLAEVELEGNGNWCM